MCNTQANIFLWNQSFRFTKLILHNKFSTHYLLRQPSNWSFHTNSYADLCSLVTQVHPVRCGKVHRLWHAVATAHFRDEGTGVTDHKLAAALDRTVNFDAFAAQHLWRDLGEQEKSRERQSVTFGNLFFGTEVAKEGQFLGGGQHWPWCSSPTFLVLGCHWPEAVYGPPCPA